ncbi:hypothetical protein TNCV_435511 [Trichonephila clavipes]|nr:hypothetical protein TNCV_435511 [Trichonephila clavipes]
MIPPCDCQVSGSSLNAVEDTLCRGTDAGYSYNSVIARNPYVGWRNGSRYKMPVLGQVERGAHRLNMGPVLGQVERGARLTPGGRRDMKG